MWPPLLARGRTTRTLFYFWFIPFHLAWPCCVPHSFCGMTSGQTGACQAGWGCSACRAWWAQRTRRRTGSRAARPTDGASGPPAAAGRECMPLLDFWAHFPATNVDWAMVCGTYTDPVHNLDLSGAISCVCSISYELMCAWMRVTSPACRDTACCYDGCST